MNTVQRFSVLALAGLGLAAAHPAQADDWVAERLRGSVLVYQDGEWVPLQRGDVVSDDRYIKTLGNGRVQFTRGKESIDLGGHTMVQILDRDSQQFTNVHQHYGKVAVEADKRDVNHFAVTTPYLAAIVKGTQFVVQSGSTGASVSVDRGQVNVANPDTGTSVDISPGQGASVDPAGIFKVSATGGAELPIVHDSAGGVIKAPGSGNGNGNGGNASTAGGKGNGNSGSNSVGTNSGNDKGNNGNAGGNGNGGSNNGNGNANNGNAGGNSGNSNAGGNNGDGNGNSSGKKGD